MKWPEQVYVVQTGPGRMRFYTHEEAAAEFLLVNPTALAVAYPRPEKVHEQVANEVPRRVTLTDAPVPEPGPPAFEPENPEPF